MPTERDRLLRLSLRQNPFLEDFDPAEASSYQSASRDFVGNASKAEVIDLVAGPADNVSARITLTPFAIYPLLQAYVERYGACPELLVELYRTMVGSGGNALFLAIKYIQMAFERYPDDYFVLWELFKSHHYSDGIPTPSFPHGLKFDTDDRRHEEECLRRILRVRPADTLATRLITWLDQSDVCYHRATTVPVPIPELDRLTRPLGSHSWREILELSDP